MDPVEKIFPVGSERIELPCVIATDVPPKNVEAVVIVPCESVFNVKALKSSIEGVGIENVWVDGCVIIQSVLYDPVIYIDPTESIEMEDSLTSISDPSVPTSR
jgi:hypothetical protein